MRNKLLVIDDLRGFIDAKKDSQACYARNSVEGVQGLKQSAQTGIEELWLDHDLGMVTMSILSAHEVSPRTSSFGVVMEDKSENIAEITIDEIWPAVSYLELFPKNNGGDLYPVDKIYVHTSNRPGAEKMMSVLTLIGYNVERVDAKDYFIQVIED